MWPVNQFGLSFTSTVVPLKGEVRSFFEYLRPGEPWQVTDEMVEG